MENIGKCFLDDRGKRKDMIKIIDRWTTTNAKGEIVQIKYIGEHIFCGQVVRAEYPSATIARFISKGKEIK